MSRLSAGHYFTCGIRADGTLACWGVMNLPTTPPSGTFALVASGHSHMCAIRTDGTMACWGGDQAGESTPPSGTFTDVSVGANHSIGLRTDGSVARWGRSDFDLTDLPDGTFTSVDSGHYHACAIESRGTLSCWGLDNWGQAPRLTVAQAPFVPGTTGVPYDQSLVTTGGTTPYTYAIADGSLPPGLALAGTGALTGTPTLSGTYEFTIRVRDGATQPLGVEAPATIVIAKGPPHVTVNLGSVDVRDGVLVDAVLVGASNAEGEALNLGASTGTLVPSGMGTWSWSPTTTDGDEPVTEPVVITATDPGGIEATASFYVTVYGDGIHSSIDDDPIRYSSTFTHGSTIGTIDRAGLTVAASADTITHADGVLLEVTGFGPERAVITLTCGDRDYLIQLGSGDGARVACGSLVLGALSGSATVLLGDGTIVVVPAGVDVSFEPQQDDTFTGSYTITNLSAADATVGIDGQSITLEPSETTTARARSLMVTTALDVATGSCNDGECSLRDAIDRIGPGGTITFGVAGPIVLTLGELEIRRGMIIEGSSAGMTIDGNGGRILTTRNFATELHDLTLIGGRGINGGAIATYLTPLLITNGTIIGNHAIGSGGGIFAQGGVVTIVDSTLAGNSAEYSGGAISLHADPVLHITASTVAGNHANTGAGGISFGGGSLTLSNTTISGNTTLTSGGGLAGSGPLVIGNSTIVANTAATGGGLLYGSYLPITMTNSILALNTAQVEPDFYSFRDGFELVTGGPNLLATDPGLETDGSGVPLLADNGGRTQTHALVPGSLAIGAGDLASCPATDQRGVPRPFGGGCDIGAYEAEFSSVPQTITIDALPAATYGDAPVSIVAVASSGLDVTLAIASGPCELTPYFTARITGAGTCEIVASQAGNADFEPAPDATHVITIVKAALIVRIENESISYLEATPDFMPFYDGFVGDDDAGGLVGGFTLTYAGVSPTVYGPSDTPPVTSGTYTVTPGGYASDDYDFVYEAGALTIERIEQEPVVLLLGGVAVVGDRFELQAEGGSGTGAIRFVVEGTGCAILTEGPDEGMLEILSASDTCTIRATRDGDENYLPQQSEPLTFMVEMLEQHITFDALEERELGDSEFELTATASSGLDVSYRSESPDTCSVSTATVHLIAVGTCRIVAMQEGNAVYLFADEVAQSFEIVLSDLPTPRIDGVSPSSVLAGSGAITLEIVGDGFIDGSTFAWRTGGGSPVVLQVSASGSANASLTVPAELLESAVTAEITATNPAPGGGASNVAIFFVTQGGSAISVASGTSTEPSGTAYASTGELSAQATGSGTVLVAEFDSNPASTPTFSSDGSYFDVYVTSGSTFASIVLAFCPAEVGDVLYWFDGGSWLAVAPQEIADGCIVASLTGGTSPNLTQLGGTVFALTQKEPQEIAFTDVPDELLVGAIALVSATGGGSAEPVTFTSTTPTICSLVDGALTTLAVGTCTVQADQAGSVTHEPAASATVDVPVRYGFSGFGQPVHDAPTVNVIQAGRAVALKWSVFGDADAPIATLSSVSVRSRRVACDLGAPDDEVEEFAAGSSGFRNLGNGAYQFNWTTARSYGATCRDLLLDLGDGREQIVHFRFR